MFILKVQTKVSLLQQCSSLVLRLSDKLLHGHQLHWLQLALLLPWPSFGHFPPAVSYAGVRITLDRTSSQRIAQSPCSKYTQNRRARGDKCCIERISWSERVSPSSEFIDKINDFETQSKRVSHALGRQEGGHRFFRDAKVLTFLIYNIYHIRLISKLFIISLRLLRCKLTVRLP